jgi:hypothetical protein
MEPGFYFTALVIGTGVFHLVCQVADHLEKRLHSHSFRKNLSSRKTRKRDDWYMFFHRSQLTGKEEESQASYSENRKNKRTSGLRRPKDRRIMARISLR